jgi:hypothetical protein
MIVFLGMRWEPMENILNTYLGDQIGQNFDIWATF